MTHLLEVLHLKKFYSNKAVVNDLSFLIEEGEAVGLLGPNGAGKTTAFYMTVGLIQPDQGEVFFKGMNITHLPMHREQKWVLVISLKSLPYFAISLWKRIFCVFLKRFP